MITRDTQFGLKDGKVVHISEIPVEQRGLKCGCICPKCGALLVAKKGNKNKHHFTHYETEQCENAFESALHLFAKETLQKFKRLYVPEFKLWSYITDDLDIIVTDKCFYDKSYDIYFLWLNDEEYIEVCYEKEKLKSKKVLKSMELNFDKVTLEESIGDIRADVVMYKEKERFIVEIKVTHEVDEEKRKKIEKLKINTIEIDLSSLEFDYYDFDRKTVEQAIINKLDIKKWLYHKEIETQRQIMLEESKKEINEIKKKRKLDEIKSRIRREAQEKNLIDNLEKFKKLTDLTYQHEQRKLWATYLPNNPHWQNVSRYLEINIDNIPLYLNQEIEGDFIFGCDRRLWQSRIFASFIYKWKHSPKFNMKHVISLIENKYDYLINKTYNQALINIKGAYKNIQFLNNDNLNERKLNLNHKELIMYANYPDLSIVINKFLEGLMKYNFLDYDNKTKHMAKWGKGHPYHYWYYRKKQGVYYKNGYISELKDYYHKIIQKRNDKHNVYIIILSYWSEHIKLIQHYGYKLNKNYHWIKKVSNNEFEKELKLLDSLKEIEVIFVQ